MDSEGQRGSANPQAMLTALLSKREKVNEELRMIERQVYDLETSYLHESSQTGSVLKGFGGFLSLSESTNMKRSRKFQPEDRLFSLSSVTSPGMEGLIMVQVVQKVEAFLQMDKGGRITLREERRVRPPSIEQDMDDDDDVELSVR